MRRRDGAVGGEVGGLGVGDGDGGVGGLWDEVREGRGWMRGVTGGRVC